MKVEINFQEGGGWVAITNLVKDTMSITNRASSDSYHCATNLCNFELNYSTNVFDAIRNATKDMLLKVYDDSNIVIFSGYFKPNTTLTYNGIVELQNIKIEAQDFTEYLRVPSGTAEDDDVAYENYYIMNNADKPHSIVHALFTKIGLDVALIDANVNIMNTVEAFTSTSFEEEVLSMLDTLLYEYGWVCNWNEQGLFSPIKWLQTAGATPTFTFDDSNIMGDINDSKNTIERDGSQVTWYGLGTKANTRVYTADLPFADDGSFEGYAVLAGFDYPVEANVDDDTTGQKMKVWQEYTDSGVRYKTSKYVQDEYAMDFALKNADFAEILITKSHVLSDRKDAGLDLILSEFKNRRARILYRNAQLTSRDLYFMHIDATVVYKSSQQKCKVQLVANSNNLENYDSRFLFTQIDADKLCQAKSVIVQQGTNSYSFNSESKVNEGAYVQVSLGNGTVATGIVLERNWIEKTNIYSYKIQGYSSTYVAVTARSVIQSSISPDSSSVIGMSKPSTPSASFSGETVFHYYPDHTVPTKPSTDIKLNMADPTFVVSGYQWYYTNNLGNDVAISGATTNTLHVDYNSSWLQGDKTVIVCKLNNLYVYVTTITVVHDMPIYDISFTTDTFAIAYDQYLSNVSPTGNLTFTAILTENYVPILTDVTYTWTAGGCLSVVSGANTSTLTAVANANRQSGETFVKCVIVHGSITREYKAIIPVTSYDSTLDWSVEWNETKAKMFNQDIVVGKNVVAGAIYAGTLEDDPNHVGFKRLKTGIAFGNDIQIAGTTTTEKKSGLVTVQNGIITAFMDTEGNATWNGTITSDGLNTSIANINGGLTISDNGWGATSDAEQAYFDSDELFFDRKDNDAVWGGESAINNASSEFLSLIGQSDNSFRVAYRRNSDNYLVQKTSTDGITWSGESIINNASISYPSLIQQSDNSFRIAYRRADSYLVQKTSTDGVTWSDESIINNASSNSIVLIQQSDNSFRIVYRRNSDGYLVQKTSTDGTTWSGESIINVNSILLPYPTFIQKNNGSFVIAYTLTGTTTLVQRTSTDGVTWGGEVIINSVSSGYPSLIQQIDGNLRVVYRRNSDGYLVQRLSSDGNTWSGEIIVSNTSGKYSSLVQQNDGNVRIVYVGVSDYIYQRTLKINYRTVEIKSNADLTGTVKTYDATGKSIALEGSNIMLDYNNGATSPLICDRTNWNGTGNNGQSPALQQVVGQLVWRGAGYNNGHAIFDASAGLSPEGTVINRDNASIRWISTYPSLMGWNGTNTYGVKVDRAYQAENLTGYCQDITNTDLNNLVSQGFYKGQNLTNAPEIPYTWWFITMQSHDTTWVRQTASNFAFGNEGITFYRIKSGGVWQPWEQIYDSKWNGTRTIGDTVISAESVITANSGDAEKSLIQLNDGTFMLAYRETTYAFLVRKTSADGVTWSVETPLINSGCYSPSLIQQSDGTLRVVYVKAGTSYLAQRSSIDNGTTWSAEIIITSALSEYPSLIQQSDNTLRVAYRRLSDGYLVQKTSTDGITWSGESIINNASISYNPSLIQGHDGVLYVAYINGGQILRIKKSIDNGVNWDASITITNSVSQGNPIHLIQQSDNTFRIVHRRGSDGYLVQKISVDAVLWSNESIINSSTSSYPAVVCQSNDTIRCVYNRLSDGYAVQRTFTPNDTFTLTNYDKTILVNSNESKICGIPASMPVGKEYEIERISSGLTANGVTLSFPSGELIQGSASISKFLQQNESFSIRKTTFNSWAVVNEIHKVITATISSALAGASLADCYVKLKGNMLYLRLTLGITPQTISTGTVILSFANLPNLAMNKVMRVQAGVDTTSIRSISGLDVNFNNGSGSVTAYPTVDRALSGGNIASATGIYCDATFLLYDN